MTGLYRELTPKCIPLFYDIIWGLILIGLSYMFSMSYTNTDGFRMFNKSTEDIAVKHHSAGDYRRHVAIAENYSSLDFFRSSSEIFSWRLS